MGPPIVSLILPCYNEMEHIEVSLREISKFMSFAFPQGNYEIILVDDFSTDGTRTWLQKKTYPNCVVHLNERNLGRGGAVKVGMKMSHGSYVGFIDIDREVSEAYIPKFVQAIKEGFDLVVGTRVYQITFHPYVLYRHLLTQVYRWLLRKFISCSTSDSETGYKFFSRRLVDYILAESRFNDWFWDSEVVLLSERFGVRITEQLVAFQRNTEKTSTVSVIKDGFRFFKAVSSFKKLLRQQAYRAPEFHSRKVASF